MDWLAFAGSIIGGIIGGLFTYLGVRITIKHDDKKKKEEELKKAIEARPRLEIVKFKKLGPMDDESTDLDMLFLNYSTVGDESKRIKYSCNTTMVGKENFVCSYYVFKNTGKTEIDSLCFISNLRNDTCLFSLKEAEKYIKDAILNFDVWSQRRFIKPGEEIKIRVCYLKDLVIHSNLLSAPVGIYIQDINGRYWHQPLFCPNGETDNSNLTSGDEFTKRKEI